VRSRTDTTTSEELLQKTIRLEPTQRVPSGPGIRQFAATFTGMSQAEFLDPDKAEEAIIQTFDDLGGWDILVASPGTERYSCGMPLKTRLPGRELPDDAVVQVLEEELMLPEDYDFVIKHGYNALNHRLERRSDPGRIPNNMRLEADAEARRQRLLEAWRERGVAFMGSSMLLHPFQLFSLGRSLAKFAVDVRRTPDKVKAAVEACLPDMIDDAVNDVACNGHKRVCCALDRGSPVFVSAKTFEDLVLPIWLAFVNAMVKAGIDVVFHCDTNWTPFLPYFKEFPPGRCALQLDGATDIYRAKEVLRGHMALMGDVPATLLCLGSPDEVTAYCERLIEVVGEGGGFILSSGCSTPHDSKVENVRAMVAAGNS
jgi:hypothetical protein